MVTFDYFLLFFVFAFVGEFARARFCYNEVGGGGVVGFHGFNHGFVGRIILYL